MSSLNRRHFLGTASAALGAAETRERCYGFHVPWPGLGHILPKGAGFKWEQERISWGS